jgi:hypothetical protein
VGADFLVERRHQTGEVHLELLAVHAALPLGPIVRQLPLDVQDEVVFDPPSVVGVAVRLGSDELVERHREEDATDSQEEVHDSLFGEGQDIKIEAETSGQHVRKRVEPLQKQRLKESRGLRRGAYDFCPQERQHHLVKSFHVGHVFDAAQRHVDLVANGKVNWQA